MLTADQIREAISGTNSLKPTEAKAFGGVVYVMRMTADQRDAMDISWQREREDTKGVGYRAYVVAWCLCDDNNRPLFRDVDGGRDHSDMWESLRVQPASLVDRLFDVAAKLNGMLPGDDEAAVDVAAGN